MVDLFLREQRNCLNLFLHPLQLFEVSPQLIRAELEVTSDFAKFVLKETLKAFLLCLGLPLEVSHATKDLLHLVLDLLLLHACLLDKL